jgi:hypothetical protein
MATRDSWKIAAILALMIAASSVDAPRQTEEPVLCHTDAECSLLCDETQMQLPLDHPDYCDGGPSGGVVIGIPLGEATWL